MAAPAEREARLVLASYNVHGCVGSDGLRDAGRIARVIRELDADVVALQEVDARSRLRGEEDPFEALGEATQLCVIRGPTLCRDEGAYGNALLTRLPVENVERVDLSVPGHEPRGALKVTLRAQGRSLGVVATHLGLHARERRAQVDRLLELLGNESPVALLGDINEWRPGARALRLLGRRMGKMRSVRTFPARRPILALDRIWVRPPQLVTQLGAHASATARVASDHLPVFAEVALPA